MRSVAALANHEHARPTRDATSKWRRRRDVKHLSNQATSRAGARGVHFSKVKLASITAAGAAAVMAVTLASHASAAPTGATQAKATVVLVNGAWANNASWSRVIKRLQNDDYTVVAPPNPLQSLSGDAQTIADLLQTIPGPIVLVGHSYGGMVISNAATGNPNVKALVYIDAFIPDQGESAFGLTAAQPGSCVGSANAFTAVPYPGAAAGDFDTYLKAGPDLPYPGFAQCFANGLPASQAAVLAATQRPIAFSAGSAPSGTPAWQTIPSWSLIGTADHVIPPAEQLFMSQRAKAHITEINAGHLSLISNPGAVTSIIIAAAQATG